MDPGLVATCRAGEAVTQEQLIEALGKRAVLGAAVRQFFDRYDILLSPTMPIVAAYADPRSDDEPNPANYRDWLTYTWAFNLTRNPSASIPCGFAEGLPIGLMVTGPLYDDLGALQACRAYEQAVGTIWPTPSLTAALAKIAGSPDAAVSGKIRAVAP
jgi:aspartyl-tRNA(Asn)/glutamyl-tRNA(Gln) amidotransferase subunit A